MSIFLLTIKKSFGNYLFIDRFRRRRCRAIRWWRQCRPTSSSCWCGRSVPGGQSRGPWSCTWNDKITIINRPLRERTAQQRGIVHASNLTITGWNLGAGIQNSSQIKALPVGYSSNNCPFCCNAQQQRLRSANLRGPSAQLSHHTKLKNLDCSTIMLPPLQKCVPSIKMSRHWQHFLKTTSFWWSKIQWTHMTLIIMKLKEAILGSKLGFFSNTSQLGQESRGCA